MNLRQKMWKESHIVISVVHGGVLGAYLGFEISAGRFLSGNELQALALLPALSFAVLFIDRIGHRAADMVVNSATSNLLFGGLVGGLVCWLASSLGLNPLAIGAVLGSWVLTILFDIYVVGRTEATIMKVQNCNE